MPIVLSIHADSFDFMQKLSLKNVTAPSLFRNICYSFYQSYFLQSKQLNLWIIQSKKGAAVWREMLLLNFVCHFSIHQKLNLFYLNYIEVEAEILRIFKIWQIKTKLSAWLTDKTGVSEKMFLYKSVTD